MSSVRMDISPAISTRKCDISAWKESDISKLRARGKRRYNKRKSAVEDYFTTDLSIEEITQRHHLSSEILMKLVGQCCMQHEDGAPWGYRALAPGVVVIDHTPALDPEQNSLPNKLSEDTPEEVTDKAFGSIHDSLAEDAVAGNDAFIEDDEDTEKRPAIKIASGDVQPVDDESTSLNGHSQNGHSHFETGVVEAEENNTDVQNVPENVVEAESQQSIESESELATAEVEVAEEGADAEIIVTEEEEEAVKDESVEEGEVEVVDAKQVVANVDEDAVHESPDVSEADISRTQLVVRENLIPAILPLYGRGRKRINIKKVAQIRRSMRNRWIQEVQSRRKHKRIRSIVATIVVASLLFVIFIPLGTGLAAYSTYSSIRNVALDGVNHLLAVKALLPVSKSDPTAALDANKLQQAQIELNSAENDFVQLQQLVNRADVQSAIQQFAPQYSSQLDMAKRLVQVGIDVSRMGKEVVGVALLGANILHSSPLANGNTKPLISSTDVTNAEGVMIHAQYFINDIQLQMSHVSIKNLPISATQKKQLSSVMGLMPKVQDYISQGQGLIGIVSWLLGVDHARRFLVQTMDRGELRPGGGFTGMYGILTIQNGRMAPFSLTDVTELDYAGNGMELGRQAPPQYRSWMKFGNWGLRDANLSGDFPTNAKMAMQVFQEEGGGPVDGNIALTPTVIAHVLNVIGPIKVPQYNETITAQNLEDKLHYYQQDFSAIRLQRQLTGTNNAATRKAFTSLLGHLLLDKVRHEPVKVLVKILQNAVKDIQARDLEIYFTNPLAENWMVQHGYSGAMDTFSKQDGFMVVQSNISISKASQYVHTTEQDSISFDAQGGANHNLTITLNYKQTGPVYGYDTYADYIRVYAPANAQLQGGDGFDSAICTVPPPLNGTGTTPSTTSRCAQYYSSSFPSNTVNCPSGNYSLGPSGFGGNWSVGSIGGPTELTTDLPGRAMWGGLTLTPKNCVSTIKLQWYVPNAVKHINGHPVYTLLVQKQGGYIPTIQLAIDTSAISGLKPFNFQGDMSADSLFKVSSLTKK